MSEANRVLAQVLVSLLYSGQADRQRVCIVLHDDVGQVMSAVGLQLELLRMDFEQCAPDIALRTKSIQQMLESALVPLRQLVTELDPVPWARTSAETKKAKQ